MLFWIFAVCSLKLIGAEPQKVYSLVYEFRSPTWYLEQINAWKAELDKNKKNTQAWQYYFTATRMLNMTKDNTIDQKEFETLKPCTEILKEMEKAIPKSFEYNYCMAWQVVGTEEAMGIGIKYLKKAEEIEPDRYELYSLLVVYYEKVRDLDNKKKYCEKWYKSNQTSLNLLTFAYNSLSGVEDEAIIFSGGDNDTYPLWILQNSLNIKPKVSVLNYSLLLIDDYREKLFKEMSIPKLEFDSTDFVFKPDENPYDVLVGKILTHIIKNSKRPCYFLATCNESAYSSFKDKLFLVGTAFKYSEDDIDNMAVLRNNFENVFQLDNLKQYLIYEPLNRSSYSVNTVYLPAFVKLYQHYKTSGEISKMKKVKSIAENIINTSLFPDKDILKMFE